MRLSDCELLIVPGYESSGPAHWQTLWEQAFGARRVEQVSWTHPRREPWVSRIVEEVQRATRPVVIIAHSLGVAAVAHAVPRFPAAVVRGAFLVAPPDVEDPTLLPELELDFAPLPRTPLPFHSTLVASHSDPYATFEKVQGLAASWGSTLFDAGDAGHINTASGHGTWFAGFRALDQLVAMI
ncbi:MAG: serine hydrolase family protein [Deltaproteobacteria bacterium]|nr:serine hydrolase family protein [Deltaproteobacteria bacterium]MDQ3299801.1 alpha/beta hydrolase [Myxococcota bacterium]